jgi:hypothetical protein
MARENNHLSTEEGKHFPRPHQRKFTRNGRGIRAVPFGSLSIPQARHNLLTYHSIRDTKARHGATDLERLHASARGYPGLAPCYMETPRAKALEIAENAIRPKLFCPAMSLQISGPLHEHSKFRLFLVGSATLQSRTSQVCHTPPPSNHVQREAVWQRWAVFGQRPFCEFSLPVTVKGTCRSRRNPMSNDVPVDQVWPLPL